MPKINEHGGIDDKVFCTRCKIYIVPVICNDCYHNCKDWKCRICKMCTREFWEFMTK